MPSEYLTLLYWHTKRFNGDAFELLHVSLNQLLPNGLFKFTHLVKSDFQLAKIIHDGDRYLHQIIEEPNHDDWCYECLLGPATVQQPSCTFCRTEETHRSNTSLLKAGL